MPLVWNINPESLKKLDLINFENNDASDDL